MNARTLPARRAGGALWLLALGCLCALLLALFARSPLAFADSAPQAAGAASDAGAGTIDTEGSAAGAGAGAPVAALSSQVPPAARLTHGLGARPDGQATPEADRPPGALAHDDGPSPVIFPAQNLTIRFNHQRHVRDLGLTCASCHDQARTSHDAAALLLPKATRCDACHASDHSDLMQVRPAARAPIGQCAFCHQGYQKSDGNRVAPLLFPLPNLRFDHALHAARNIGCAQCHGAVQDLELATRDQLPRMRGCFNCHQAPSPASGRARSECLTCHLKGTNGMMRVAFASGALAPPSWLHDAGHGPDWLERHKQIAGNDSRFCANCHTEKYCADCHDGRVRPRNVHPNDWLDMHAIVARENQQKCASCHREQSFCLTCHQRAGVALSGPVANSAQRGRFHPPKAEWSEGPRTPRHHAWEAERNISACVSCHVERDCAICHATAGRGGRGSGFTAGPGPGTDPHPLGFRSRCASALRQNARPCLVCHTPDDPNLRDCR
jgi:hypothetical protein